MKTKYKSWILKGTLSLAVLFGASACTEDHFDVLTNQDQAGSTIWENLQATPDLDSLCMILQRTPVMKSLTDNKSTASYANLLNQTQSLTFWAPKNGTYNAKRYLDMLDQADAAEKESARLALRYKVGREFVQNHLARFNYESNKGLQEVFLMNSKVSDYDAANSLFNNIPLLAGYETIPSSNGALHVLNGYSPFFQNIKEMLESNYTPLSQIVADYEKVEFDEDNSVQGAMNTEGQMEYVDSIYKSANTFLNASSARISDEDSVYIGIVPSTQTAWDNVYSKVSSLYKYADSYWYGWSDTNKEFSYKNANAKIFDKATQDSLTNYNALREIMRGMFISASTLGGVDLDSATLIHNAIYADSLKSVNDVIYYNTNKGGANPLIADVQPTRASNGYVFELEEFDVDPTYIWADKKEYSMASDWNVSKTDNCAYPKGELVMLNADNRNDSIGGEVEQNRYRRFQVYGRNVTLRICIKLQNILSTKYRLKAVMAPNYMRSNDIQYESDGVTEKEVVSRFTANVYYDNDTRVNASQATVEVLQDSVREYVIFDELNFDRCYVNLPDGATSFAYLQIEVAPRLQNSTKLFGLNNNALNIVKVILEPIHEDEEEK